VRPVVGTTVHYVSYGTPRGEFTQECRAAVVTETDPKIEGLIGLTAINPTGMFFHPLSAGGCNHEGVIVDALSRRPRGGTWHFVGEAVCAERGTQA
jgi:hypothetical protein